MCNNNSKIVIINGQEFKDVTNQTVSGMTYNLTEAIALTRGNKITSNS